MHLRVIDPTTATSQTADVLALFQAAAAAETRVSIATIPAGTPSITSRRDEALVAPWVLMAAREAEAEGCDAIAVSSILDPGVHAAREIVGIPVLGPGEASMHVAATLGHRFSVVSDAGYHRISLIERARRFGVESRLASIRLIDPSVLEPDIDPVRTREAMVERAREAVLYDGAEAIVLGCARTPDQAALVQGALADHGLHVPVVDPSAAATSVLEATVAMGLRSSRITYPRRSATTANWPSAPQKDTGK